MVSWLRNMQVDENMERAQRRGAVTRETFWFRKDVFSKPGSKDDAMKPVEEEYEEMTMNEIFNGKASSCFFGSLSSFELILL